MFDADWALMTHDPDDIANFSVSRAPEHNGKVRPWPLIIIISEKSNFVLLHTYLQKYWLIHLEVNILCKGQRKSYLGH